MEHIDLSVRDLTFDGLRAGPPPDAAAGEPVLLLHGFPQTSVCWRHQLAALGDDGHRVVAFDQRGYSPGARPRDDAAYGIHEVVADALAVADHFGWDSFHLGGHDWGGLVAWHLAARHPERLRSLTVAASGHPRAYVEALRGWDQRRRSSYVMLFRQPWFADVLAARRGAGLRAFFRSTGLPPAEAAPYVAALGDREALRAALAWYRAMDRRLGVCGPVAVPTVFLWGTADPALGRDAAAGTARHVTGDYRFVPLDGVSHWIPEHAPDALTGALREQLARHREPAS